MLGCDWSLDCDQPIAYLAVNHNAKKREPVDFEKKHTIFLEHSIFLYLSYLFCFLYLTLGLGFAVAEHDIWRPEAFSTCEKNQARS